MNISDKINKIYTALKNSDDLKDCFIIKSYPSCFKPTKSKEKIIAIGEGSSRFELKEIGGNTYVGECQIIVKVYCNNGYSTDFYKTVYSVISVLIDENPNEVDGSQIYVDSETSSLVAEIKLLFSV